jgi:hypothetical protein
MYPSRYLVKDMRMMDSNNGSDGGFVLTYSGYVKKHPWVSRQGEFVMDGRGIAVLDNGDVYEGETSLGMFRGNGKMKYADGSTFDGEWDNHMPHGYGVLVRSDGTVYIGTFKSGDKDGAGEELYANGSSFVGMFRGGLKNGLGRIKIEPTNDVVDGVYVDGKLEGAVTVTYGNGDVFIGKFSNGKPHGEGRYQQSDTLDIYIEQFHEGRCIEGVLDDDEDPFGGLQSEPLETSSSTKEHIHADQNLEPEASVDDPEEDSFVAALKNRIAADRQPVRLIKKKLCKVLYHGSGDEYYGEWKRESSGANRRGVRHGQGRLSYRASGEVFEGTFVNNVREGFGIVTFPAPVGSEASVNESTGDAQHLEPDCGGYLLSYAGEFHNDLYDGKALLTFSDGTTVEQFFTKGTPNGLCHETPSESSRRFVGEVRSTFFDKGVEVDLDYHRRPGDTALTEGGGVDLTPSSIV